MTSAKLGMKQELALFLALAVFVVSSPVQASLTIAKSGKPACTIIAQANATAPEQNAADELSEYLQAITGASFAVHNATDFTNLPDHAIIVGSGALAQSLFPDSSLNQLGSEEFVIRTKGNNLLLAGGNPRGTLYAVYHFLQDQCGVRWWTPWATNVPRTTTLRIPNLNRREQPAFEYREPFWFCGFDPVWKAHNCVNGEHNHIPTELGGSVIYKGFVHTLYSLVPPDKFFDSHPEWFSLINGKRTHDRAQLCLSNPELRDFAVQQVRQWLRDSPDATIISVSQNDCGGACQCTNCQAIDQAEDSPSGSMIAFVNYIAEKIQPEFPNVAIDTLAYQYTRKPPKHLQPRSNVIVRLCSIECNFRAPLDDPSNAAFLSDLQDWSKICHRLYVWDYVTDFSDYLLPQPNWFTLGPNLRLFHQYNVQGVFEEGAYQSNGPEMAELRSWMLAQLMWNPQQDDRALIQEFLDGYYGKPAARPIRQYLDLMQKASNGYFLGCYTGSHPPYLSFKTLNKAEHFWQAAEKASVKDPEKLQRVEQAHLAVQYAFLRNWTGLRKECAEQKAVWPMSPSPQALASHFAAICNSLPGNDGTKGFILNEPGLTAEKFLTQFEQKGP